MFDVSLGEDGSLPHSLNQLYGCVNSVIRDRPILGVAGIDGDSLEWGREVMNYSELARDFLLPQSQW